ncbi:ankyrin repeat domain-containing protein [Micromonospora sp. M12]
MTDDLDAETLAFAHRMFDLARAGSTEELAAQVDAGLPVNLTNDKGDTLLILAAYHAQPDTVTALLGRGADHTGPTTEVRQRWPRPSSAAAPMPSARSSPPAPTRRTATRRHWTPRSSSTCQR